MPENPSEIKCFRAYAGSMSFNTFAKKLLGIYLHCYASPSGISQGHSRGLQTVSSCRPFLYVGVDLSLGSMRDMRKNYLKPMFKKRYKEK